MIRTYRRRLVHVAALLLLNAATLPAVYATDYASHEYGAANTADAPATAPARTSSPPAAAEQPTQVGDTPHRGETMADVRARHGAPLSRRGPVGRPPITRWDYAGYHVYFEGNRVIHTVIPADPEPLHHIQQLKTGNP